MIKNVVFDLGNVLISFRPAEYFDNKAYPESIKTRILSDIFGSEEWAMLDNGIINTNDAIEGIASKSSLKKEEIAHVFNLRTDLLFPLDQNVRILPELKKQGFRLYFLSNFPADLFKEVKKNYYFFDYFDGGVISAEANVSKPDSLIYDILLKKYSLLPEECLYIDDIEINVKAGVKAGMKGLITFGSMDISKQIEKALALTTSL